MNYLNPKNIIIFVIVYTILGVISFFDGGLAISLLFLLFLVKITLFVLSKFGIGNRTAYALFLIVILIHLGATLFIHYTEFYPFGGGEGDQAIYHQVALELSERFRQGNFSLEDLEISKHLPFNISHWWPVIIGGLYAITVPDILVGKALVVWLAAISSLLVFFIVRELGASNKWAFFTGFFISIYPSYLYLGSLLLKDTMVVPLSLFVILLWLKLFKNFSFKGFALFFIVLGLLTHFRFYIGYAVIFPFIFLWFFLAPLSIKKRLAYLSFIIPLLGFIPLIFASPSQGYYGIGTFKTYLNLNVVNFYREVAYNPKAAPSGVLLPESETIAEEISMRPTSPGVSGTKKKSLISRGLFLLGGERPSGEISVPSELPELEGSGSTITVEKKPGDRFAFLKSSLGIFINTLLGPFPWQITKVRQLFALLETIPWYFLLIFIFIGVYRSRRSKSMLPLLFFSLAVFASITILITNFGIITRLRMPAFIILSCFIPFAFMRKSYEKREANDNPYKVCQVASVDLSLKFLLFDQMKYLKNQGFEVWGVASSGKWTREIRTAGIPVKTIEIRRKIFSPFSDLIALLRLVRFFQKEEFDIVHTHTPKASLLGQIAAIVADVPIRINTIHGFYFQDNSPKLKRFLFIVIEKIVAGCANLTFMVNREDIKTAVKENIASPETITYLGDGIDLNHFDPARFSQDSVQKKKDEFKIDPRKKVVGIVARLVKEKGYLDLFEAFENVLKKFPDTVLLVIGPVEPEKTDGVSPDIVKKYGIEKNVVFLGERTDVAELYPLMDIFVLPSYREGLGLSILEASAMEVPVIATDIRGCREAVDDGVTGVLVPVKNPGKLSTAIIDFLEHPNKAEKMGRAGREKIKKEFEATIVFNRIKIEYQRLIKEKLLSNKI